MLKERRRRKQEEPLSFYKPLPHQARFHSSLARERAFIASNRSGKSEANVIEVIRYALGMNPHRPDIPVPNTGWVISVSNEAQREILQPKFEKYMPKGIIAKTRLRPNGVWDQLVLTNGSIIGFKSCEMDRKVLQGVALNYASFDEEPEKDVYDEVKMRLADYMGDLWATMTPVNGLTWTYDTWVDAETKIKGVEVFGASMWDNAKSVGGYIEDEEIRRLEAEIADPIMRRIRLYGEYHSQVGRIYKSFDRRTHGVQDLPQHFWNQDGTLSHNYDYYVGIDTGRCFAAVFVLVDYFGNIWIFDEYYGEDKPINVHARALLNLCTTYGIWPEFIIDPSSQFTLDLAEQGINCLRGDNEVLKGIEAVQQYMTVRTDRPKGWQYANPHFFVVLPRCKEFLREISRYQWDSPAQTGSAAGEKKNQPRKKDDHLMDSVRYVCVTHPDPARPPEGEEDARPISSRIHDRVVEKIANQNRNKGNSEKDPWGIQEE